MADETQKDPNQLSLSAAILAPLNAVFEAQVQAARSFLSFVLQLGFKPQYSDDELKAAPKTPSKGAFKSRQEKRSRRDELLRKRNRNLDLTEDETVELAQYMAPSGQKELSNLWFIDYDEIIKSEGQDQVVQTQIPVLALLPVNPIGIDEADVRFQFKVETSNETYLTGKESDGYEEVRPWMTIHPKRLMGKIIPEKATTNAGSNTSSSAIDIHIKLKTGAIPAGLQDLLTSLTHQATQSTKA